MATALKTRLYSETIKPKIGARVLNTKAELLSGELSLEIRSLLEERAVLVFPKLNLTDEEQIAFTQSLGQFTKEMRGEDVFEITLDKKRNAQAEYLKGSLFWHIDGTMHQYPIHVSLLTSKVLPTWGGNTEFANTAAAYNDLSAETKLKIAGLKVKHSAWTSLFYYEPEPSQEKLEEMVALGETELPIVWTHRSGRKSLVLGCTAHHVVDMDWIESALLLNGLRDFATSEPYHYAHEWSVGDTVMWDNTVSMHRARPYDPDCGRLLHRTIVAGDEPIE
jgi:alpha-ketoglutarate-dependent taurine dioxygenase